MDFPFIGRFYCREILYVSKYVGRLFMYGYIHYERPQSAFPFLEENMHVGYALLMESLTIWAALTTTITG